MKKFGFWYVMVLAAIVIVGYFEIIRPMAQKATEIKSAEIVTDERPIGVELPIRDFGPLQIWRGVIMLREADVLGSQAVVYVESPKDDREHNFSGVPVLLTDHGSAGKIRITLQEVLANQEIYFHMIPVDGKIPEPEDGIGKEVFSPNLMGGYKVVINPKK